MLTKELKSSMTQSLQSARGYVSLAIKILEKLPDQPSNEKAKKEMYNLILLMGDANKELRQALHLTEISILPILENRKLSIKDRFKRWIWFKKHGENKVFH